MKFAFLLTQLEVGGAQVRVFQTAAELRARGHSVDVLFLYQKRSVFADELKTILSSKQGVKGLTQGIWNLQKKLRNTKYDVLVTNTAPANIIGNAVAKLVGPRRRLAVQTQPPHKLNSIYQTLDKIAGTIGIYDTIVANSKWTFSCFSEYPKAYKKRLITIVNGINSRTTDLGKASARGLMGIPPDDKIIVNIGRLSKQKGQETLVTALKQIPSADLYIAGDGELRDELTNLVEHLNLKRRVHFLGEIPGEQIATLLRAADAFAFSSRWETFGLAAVEAAASGLPIVASRLTVLEEVLQTEEGIAAAKFVSTDNADELAAALNIVLNDTTAAQELSRLSLEAAKHHSMSRHVDRILNAI